MTPKNKYNHSYANVARSALLLGSSFVCASPLAHAQGEAQAEVHELDALVVVANRLEMPIQRVGSSVEVLDAFELRRGEETFLIDAIREVPGFYLRNNGGPGGVFSITTRGLSSNRPTVLLNGIDVSNPASGEIINPGNLFTGNLSRVEILKGPQSSLYGADALAGVIAIDTLGSDQPSGGRASVAYGSYDTYDYSIGHSGSHGGFRWSIDALQHESEGFSVQDPDFGHEWADDDAYDNTAVSSAFEYSLSEDAHLFFSSYYLDSYSEFDPGDPAWIWGTPAGDNYAKSESVFTRLGSEFRARENWMSTLSLGYTKVDYVSYTDDNDASTENRYFSEGARYKFDWKNTVSVNDGWKLVAGFEHEIEDNRSDIGDRDNTSVYMENVVRLSEQLDWTLGARYDDNSAYGRETTYRTTFSYRMDDLGARIRGSFGTSFQAPTFYQLFNAQYGNQELKPEFGEGWDLGFEKTLLGERLFLTTTLFGNEVTDRIDWDGIYMNINRYESVGLETTARFQLSTAWRITASHTYAEAEENEQIEAIRVPRNIAALGLSWTGFDGKLTASFDGLFVGSQFSDSAERSMDVKLSSYSVFNLAAHYDVSETYSVWARIANLFDEDYREISGYQTAGTNYQAGLRMTF